MSEYDFDEVLKELSVEEQHTIQKTVAEGISKTIDEYEKKVQEIEELFKKKRERLDTDLIEVLEMIENQKTKRLHHFAKLRSDLIIKAVKKLRDKKRLEKKTKERQEQLKKFKEEYDADVERMRQFNNGELSIHSSTLDSFITPDEEDSDSDTDSTSEKNNTEAEE